MNEKKRTFYWYVLLVMAVFVCYTVNVTAGWTASPLIIKCEMAAAFLIIVAFAMYRMSKCLPASDMPGSIADKGSADEIMLQSIVLMGIVMRIGYMLYTGCDVRSHDLFGFEEDAGGHAGYILTILRTGRLPETNALQYYQQPLFYILGSAVSFLISCITGNTEAYALVDAAKTVSCSASAATLLLGIKLIKRMNVSYAAQIPAAALLAFCPAFYLTGGRVNPDALTAFFLVFNFYFTLLWLDDKSWKNTVILAFGYGLGMMTKISCATMALFTAGVFVYALWREEKPCGLIIKYFIFGMISLSLGLWFSIRNFMRFGQGLAYVLEQPVNTRLYCGGHSIVQRFLSVSFTELLKSPYADPWTDYNYPVYLLKSSLFGEFTYDTIYDVIPILLLSAAVIAAACMIAAIAWTAAKRTKNTMVLCAVIVFFLFIAAGIIFNIRYPFGCSMDFRYMTVLIVPSAMILSYYLEQHSQKHRYAFGCVIGFYSLMSCVMYFTV